MDSATEKLELGLQRLAKASEDPDLLGLALQSIHGALEDHFRAQLAADTQMPADQREAIGDPKRVQWKDLLDAMQLYGNLSAQDRELIWRTNGQRVRVAHGGRYNGTRAELERYASLAQQLSGYSAPAKPPKASAAPVAKAARVNKGAEAAEIPRAVRSSRPAQTQRSSISWGSIVLAVTLLVGLASYVVLRGVTRPLAQTAIPQATAATPGEPTAPATAAATLAPSRRATVNSPDGLNLRSDHTRGAAILAALPNGAQVAVIGGPVEDDGQRWWNVEANGRQGWCAGEFLTLDPTT